LRRARLIAQPIWRNYLPKQLSADADPITREFHDFNRTARGEAVPGASRRSGARTGRSRTR